MTEGKYFAIEIIGCRRPRFALKSVQSGHIAPVNGKAYRTESAARAAAANLGIEIAKCGDLYQII